MEYLRLYTKLASDAIAQNKCYYKVRPKAHYLGHVALRLAETRENPRRVDNFLSEDFVGRIKSIAVRCHRGNAAQRICQRMVMHKAFKWHQLSSKRGVKRTIAK